MSATTTEQPPAGVPADTVANRLILARAMAGHISIRTAAAICDIGRGTWQNWERGKGEPRISELVRIADKLRVRFSWLAQGGPLGPTQAGGNPGEGLTQTYMVGNRTTFDLAA